MKNTKRYLILFSCLAVSSVLFSQPGLVSQIAASPVAVATVPVQGFSFQSLWRGLLGMFSLLVIAFLLSKNRKQINWSLVGVGLFTQLILALCILYVPVVQYFFEILGRVFVKIMDFTRVGTAFLAGGLMDVNKVGYIFLFQVLPAIIFFSALTSLLYYLNVIQLVVKGIAWMLKKLYRISGAEGLTVAGNIFLGMCEAPLLVKRYLPAMNRSEMFLVMSAGMATISGGVMAAYVGMLGGNDPAARLMFAKFLLSASVMAAPAVIVFSKMLVPQSEKIDTDLSVSKDSVGANALESIANGTIEGVKLAVSIAALILVFIALVALLNYLLGDLIGHYTGLNDWLSRLAGRPVVFSFQYVLGIIFTPVAWLMGVCNDDMAKVGSLLGTKIVLNEFVAYEQLSVLKNAGQFLQEKSVIMATFVLCGFANISSIGMQIGGIGALAPNHRKMITEYGFLAMICGTLASCMSATIMGMIVG